MTQGRHILIATPERSLSEFLDIFFRGQGHEVTALSSVREAVFCLENAEIDLVVADMQMPGEGGVELIRSAASRETLAIAMADSAMPERAVSAMREGAYDHVLKPFKADDLRLVVEKALAKEIPAWGGHKSERQGSESSDSGCLIGESEVMHLVYDLIARVAPTKTNVLISGESGTGKELVARAIHDQSSRAKAPFVAVNCGAIPENLLESELFGHVKGSFTGATRTKEGLFSVASGGTLFLDEVAELPLALQVKLLRVIQDRKLRPVGGVVDQPLDVRLISATNRRLETEAKEGRFRKDLYYRLNVVEIDLPSLCDRREDIPLLLGHFMRKFAVEMDREIHCITDAAMSKLMRYDYPGNVRELENVMERAITLTRSHEIDEDVLPPVFEKKGQGPLSMPLPAETVSLETLCANMSWRFCRSHSSRAMASRPRLLAASEFLFGLFAIDGRSCLKRRTQANSLCALIPGVLFLGLRPGLKFRRP